jgi:thymidine kinase
MKGYLELHIGPMFSGKSSALITAVHRYSIINKKVAIIIPKEFFDDDKHESHNGLNFTAIPTDKLSNFPINNIEIIAIDEAHVFTDLYSSVKSFVEVHNKHVIVAGLITSFNRNAFEQVLQLAVIADKITHYTAYCVQCNDGTPGIFTLRLTDNDDQIEKDTGNNYEPVCRYHYNLCCRV